VAGLAAKINREEIYHRMHAEMWVDRLRASGEGRRRLEDAVRELWPYALGVPAEGQRGAWAQRVRDRLELDLPDVEPAARGGHTDELRGLWEEMTMVRRSVPAARW
jgi:1,2-phenylacetyl-CoA epoxidase catalytic subunit